MFENYFPCFRSTPGDIWMTIPVPGRLCFDSIFDCRHFLDSSFRGPNIDCNHYLTSAQWSIIQKSRQKPIFWESSNHRVNSEIRFSYSHFKHFHADLKVKGWFELGKTVRKKAFMETLKKASLRSHSLNDLAHFANNLIIKNTRCSLNWTSNDVFYWMLYF